MKGRWPLPSLLQAPLRRGYDELMAAKGTATATIAGSSTRMPIHRLDTLTYNRIVASGALEGEHVELLDGLVVEMSPQSAAHTDAIMLLTRHLAKAEAWLMVRLPLEVAANSEPEPDLALVEQRPARGEHVRGALLVVEVAVTSQQIDRELKARLYACAGIPVYWLVDVPARAVEVRTDPRPDGYAHCEIYRAPATVPSPLKGVDELALATLFDGADA